MAAVALALVGLAFAGPALAQKTYRCGSVYQDRPCAGQDGAVVNNTGAGKSAEAREYVDAACAARGERAQAIAWARDAGKTERDQLANAQTIDRDLIADAYRRRAAPAQLRDQVEAACMAAKRQAGSAGESTRPPAMVEAAASRAAAASAPKPPPDPAVVFKQGQCNNLKVQLDAVKLDQRTGGDAQRQESLRKRQRELDLKWAELAC